MYPNLSIGPLTLPLPPLVLILGFWLGINLSDHHAKRTDLDLKYIDNLLWYSLIAGVIGARVSFIARYPAAFRGNLLSILSINPNLFDYVGGILIAISVGFGYISKKKISGWKILDILTPFFIILLVSINISNFAAGDNFGIKTSLPWGIKLWGEIRHPVQLYYGLAGILILLIILSKSSVLLPKPGMTFIIFTILESCFFLFLSAFQEPSSLINYGLDLNQIIYWILLLASLVMFWLQNKPDKLEDINEP